jgi:hypothetical protein
MKTPMFFSCCGPNNWEVAKSRWEVAKSRQPYPKQESSREFREDAASAIVSDAMKRIYGKNDESADKHRKDLMKDLADSMSIVEQVDRGIELDMVSLSMVQPVTEALRQQVAYREMTQKDFIKRMGEIPHDPNLFIVTRSTAEIEEDWDDED